ncbi:NYN domain-containing protein [Trametes polyzona]|nr:NYN domain-containing protein [Trametes polyzona]
MRGVFDEPVAIFWDYENCAPPCTVPGYDVVNNIRQVAHQYGTVKLFKAYLELSEQSSSKSLGLRSELQSCGVSLTDCPHNGRKDVADKMMIVDMLTYAIDNPAPATVVLISGDRDFVYAVSVLRLRRYRVVVVAPYSAHTSLKSQASTVLDWDTDIMRRTTARSMMAPEAVHQAPVPDDILHRSPTRPSLAFGGTLPPVTPKINRRSSFRAAATASAAPDGGYGTPGGPSVQARHQRNISTASVEGVLRYDAPNYADRVYTRGIACQMTVPPVIGDDDGESEDEDVALNEPPIPDIVDVMGDLQERTRRGTPAMEQLDVPVAAMLAPFQAATSATPDPAGSCAPTPPPVPPSTLASTTVASSDDGGGPDVASLPSPQAALKTPRPEPFPASGIPSPILHPATAVSSARLPRAASAEPTPPISLQCEPAQVPTPSIIGVVIEPDAPKERCVTQDIPPVLCTVELPQHAYSAVATSSGGPDGSSSGQKDMDPPSPSPITTTVPDHPNTPKKTALPTPPKYSVLVRVLKESKARGNEWPIRSQVGMRIRELAPKIYTTSGFKSFKQYTAAAERDRVVIMGGANGKEWVTLSPDYDESG